MNVAVWRLERGYGSHCDAETAAKEWVIRELVASNAVDFARGAEAFALDSPVARNVLDSPEEFHVYGVEWSSGDLQLPDSEDEGPGVDYLVRVNCHLKPGDDLHPTHRGRNA
jgi:hypothetical protein